MKQLYAVFTLLIILASSNTILAQPWPNATWTTTTTPAGVACTGDEPTIEKVFIDACFGTGAFEAPNEFVYMKTGANGWNYTGFTMEGGAGQLCPPTATPLAISSNFGPATTATIDNLNAGVGTCPSVTFIAGVNPIPANANVVVYPCTGNSTVPANIIAYMCGKGPIYVIRGNYSGGAFFRNGTAMGPCNKTSKFNFPVPAMPAATPPTPAGTCTKTLVYNNKSSPPASFPPDQGSLNTGAYVLGSGAVGTSECFEVQPCIGPPAPDISPLNIDICSNATTFTSSFVCNNCTGTYSVFPNATQITPIYVGNNFPNLLPLGLPNGVNTFYISQSSFCDGAKIPITITKNGGPNVNQTVAAPNCNDGLGLVTMLPSGIAPYTYLWPDGTTNATNSLPAGVYGVTVTDAQGCPKAVNVLVTAPPVIVITTGTTVAQTCNTPGSANISVTGGTAPYTYAWSNGLTTQNLTGAAAGNYTVTVTDVKGCIKTKVITIAPNFTLPNAVASVVANVKITCSNSSVGLSGTGSSTGAGISYLWSGPGTITGGTTLSPTVNMAGTYSLTVSNSSSGCSKVVTVEVEEDKTLPTTVIATPNPITCTTTSVTLNATGTSTGTPPGYTYLWSGPGIVSGGTTLMPTVNQIGTYTISVTNTTNGCSKTEQITVVENKNIPVADAGADKLIDCINTSVTIGTPAIAGNNYLWSNGGITTATQTITNVIQPTSPVTYTLTVTDAASGCTSTDALVVTLDVTPPVITAISTVTVNCFTPNPTMVVTATGPNLTYAWSPSGPTVTAGGTYTVTVTNSVNGCSDIETKVVTEDKNDPVAVIAPPPVLDCGNSSTLTLNPTGTSTGAPGFTYNWAGPGGFTSTNLVPPAVTQDGTYFLTVTNSLNGCTKIASVTVTKDITPPMANAGADVMINCINANVTIGTAAVTGYNYLWSNGGVMTATQTINNTIQPTTPVTYTLTVTNTANGCSNTDDVVVTLDVTPPVITAISNVTVNCFTPSPTMVVTATGANLTYLWSPSGPTVTAGGTYTVTVTNSVNGCSDIETKVVTEDKNDPVAVIAPPPVLDCGNSSTLTLNPTGTSTGAPGFTYNWAGPGGFASTNLVPPAVTQDGTYFLTVTNSVNGCTKIASVTVTKDITPPMANAGADVMINCTNASVTIGTAAVTGYNYLWSNGGVITATQTINNTIQPTTPVTYTLTVTNTANGCSNTDDVVVTLDVTLPTISSISTVAVNCFTPNPTMVVTATGANLTYLWSPSGPTVTAGGTYTVTVTNSVNGCSDIETKVVTEDKDDPVAVIAPPPVLDCNNSSTLTLDPTGTSTGAPGFTYNWAGPGGFASTNLVPPAVTQDGTYFLTVTNSVNGCTKIASVTVTKDITPPMANAGANGTLNCTNNSQVLIGGASSSGGNITYLWSNGIQTATQTVSAIGTYTLTVTNTTTGCSSTSSVNIDENKTIPTADAGNPVFINCYNATATLTGTAGNGSPLSYTWSGGGITGGGTTLSPTVNAAGVYVLTVTNTVNGCSATDDVLVTSDLNQPDAAAGVSGQIDCTNPTATLNTTGSSTGANISYTWSGPSAFTSTSSNPVVSLGGIYTLTVTNTTNGCAKTATVSVVFDKTLPTAEAGTPQVITCTNSVVVLNGTGSSTGANIIYSWATSNGNITGGSSSLNPSVDKGGLYILTVTNTANGCSNTDQVSVTENKDNPVITLTGSGNITCTNPTKNLGVTVTSGGGNLSYQWSSGTGGIVGNASQQNITVNQGGTFVVLVTNITTGCTVTDQVVIGSDNALPTVNATASGVINCNDLTANLDGTGSSQGANFNFVWTGPSGYSNNSILSPSVNVGGNYTLAINNTTNGCAASKTVFVSADKTPPPASILPPGQLNCQNTSVVLTGQSNLGYLYSWTTSNGNIVGSSSGLTVTVDKQGTYNWTIINPQNGCTVTTTATVQENKDEPTIVLQPSNGITCQSTTSTLTSTGSSVGSNFVYIWTANPGQIISGQNSSQAVVGQAGVYTLKIINTNSSCEKSESLTVTDNRTYPVAVIQSPQDVNCNNSEVILNGTASSFGNNFSYNWTTSNGNILNGGNSTTPQVNKGGTYNLLVTDTNNGCAANSSILVKEDKTKPLANAGSDKIITCASNSVQLQGSGSIGPEYTYQWSNSGGNIASGSGGNTLSPTVSQTGVYTLTVKNAVNGCTETSTTNVALDLGVPTANAGVKKEINCTILTVKLDGTASSSGAGITYQWTTTNGNIVGNATILDPTVDKPGTYNLKVTNTNNSCIGNASVVVDDNRTKPTLKIITPTLVNCQNPTINLSGLGSSVGANFSYNWTTTNGNIVSKDTTLFPIIDKAGVYNLKIKNKQSGCEKDSLVTVIQNFNKPIATVPTPDLITCTTPQITLNASSSTNVQNATFKWVASAGGNIISGATTPIIKVGNAGDYTLFLTDTISRCKDSIVIKVDKDANIPTANAGQTAELNCTIQDITLKGTASQGANIQYSWATIGGFIVADATTLSPKVNKAGAYTLKVLNTTNKCEATSTVTITQDTLKPTVAIAKPAILNCKTTVVPIDATTSSSGQNFPFVWSMPANAVVLNGNSLNPSIKLPGTYALTITNTKNTCKASNSIIVEQDIVVPQANLTKPDTLNCRNLSIKLSGTASANSGFYTFTWDTPANGITQNANTLQPTVNVAGIYKLVVEDTVNFCKTTVVNEVIKNVLTPIVDAGLGGNLTCTVFDIALKGTATNGLATNFIYNWTSKGGNIAGAINTLNAKAESAGTYFLQVENKTNGCKAIDSTVVTQDANVPKVEILTSGDLDCKAKTLELDASGSSQGAGITFEWKAAGGAKIDKGETTLKPTVSGAGVYTLTIFNTNNNCTKSIDKTIKIDTVKPIINITKDILTCAKTQINLDAKVFQANNFDFNWATQNGAFVGANNTLQVAVSKPTEYTITVKNKDNECESTKSVVVFEDKILPTTNAGPALEINCQDSILTLQGTKSSIGNDFVYNWTTNNGFILNGEKTLSPKINKEGDYYLSIFNKSNGCSQKDTVEIKINKVLPTIVTAAPAILTCTVLDVIVSATATTTGNAAFAWATSNGNILNGVSSDKAKVNEAGTYNLQVTDDKNKCKTSTSVLVVQDTIRPIANAGADVELNCKKPELDIQGTATGSNLVFAWTTSNGNIVANANQSKVTVKSAGVYKLSVSNSSNGCKGNDEMEVTFLGAPKAVIVPPKVLNCVAKTVTLDNKGSDVGADYQYTWSDDKGTTLGTTPTISVSQPGKYNLSVYNSNNECEAKKQVDVTQDIVNPFADAGLPGVIDCEKGFVNLNAGKSSLGAKFAYDWSGGQVAAAGNTIEPKVTAQAIYTLLVTNTENGCTASDTVSVTSLKPAILEAVGKNPLCNGGLGSITFTSIAGGSPPYTYSVNGGKNYFVGNLYNSLKPGKYVVFVQDTKGCEDSTTVTIVDPPKVKINLASVANVKIGNDIRLKAEVIPSTPPVNYIKWTPSDSLSCGDCLDPLVIQPKKDIRFDLVIKNANGCEARSSTNVVIDHFIPVYAPTVFSPNEDGFNDRFFIQADAKLVINIKSFAVFDRWGDKVHEERNISVNDALKGWDGKLRGKDMTPNVFVWYAEIEFIDGQTKEFKGDVTLYR